MTNNPHTEETAVGLKSPDADSPMLSACLRRPSTYTPVWLMRQAGRYLPAYRQLRGKAGFLELCKNPDLAAEITLMPVNELNVDAAIIFADILLLLEPLGTRLHFAAGEGPVIENPIRDECDVYRLEKNDIIASLSYVFSAISKARVALGKHLPLIGFSGGPFTLAAYLIEGGTVGNLARTKTFMYEYPQAWQHLMTLLSSACAQYLLQQKKAGVDIVQIFDSWLGYLSPADFIQYVLPYSKNLVSTIKEAVPVIYFGTSTGSLLTLIHQTQCQVIGLDWRVDLSCTWKKLDYQVAVQGNLDPVILLGNKENIAKQAKRILAEAAGRPGHIFNLGHGVLPETPVENVKYLINLVHELSGKIRS